MTVEESAEINESENDGSVYIFETTFRRSFHDAEVLDFSVTLRKYGEDDDEIRGHSVATLDGFIFQPGYLPESEDERYFRLFDNHSRDGMLAYRVIADDRRLISKALGSDLNLFTAVALLERPWVHPGARGKGISLRLLREAQHVLSRTGLLVILKADPEYDWGKSHHELAKYYQSEPLLGWKPISVRKHPGWLVAGWEKLNPLESDEFQFNGTLGHLPPINEFSPQPVERISERPIPGEIHDEPASQSELRDLEVAETVASSSPQPISEDLFRSDKAAELGDDVFKVPVVFSMSAKNEHETWISWIEEGVLSVPVLKETVEFRIELTSYKRHREIPFHRVGDRFFAPVVDHPAARWLKGLVDEDDQISWFSEELTWKRPLEHPFSLLCSDTYDCVPQSDYAPFETDGPLSKVCFEKDDVGMAYADFTNVSRAGHHFHLSPPRDAVFEAISSVGISFAIKGRAVLVVINEPKLAVFYDENQGKFITECSTKALPAQAMVAFPLELSSEAEVFGRDIATLRGRGHSVRPYHVDSGWDQHVFDFVRENVLRLMDQILSKSDMTFRKSHGNLDELKTVNLLAKARRWLIDDEIPNEVQRIQNSPHPASERRNVEIAFQMLSMFEARFCLGKH
jgi:GNAT superfamily N-acetyltransferase